MTTDLSKGIKIILLGESGVGKTNLINVTTGEDFEQNSMSSSSGSYKEGFYISSTKKKYVYHLWDTAGQEAYRSLNKIFIKNAKVVIFVYAIDNEPSFKELSYWIDLAKTELGSGFVMGLVANKIDLYEEQQVKEEVAREFAEKTIIKDSDIYKEIAKLNPKDTLQLVLECETEDEKDFYEMVGDYLLQKKQREVLGRNAK